MRRVFAIIILYAICISSSEAQDKIISFYNHSFEDLPRAGIPPTGWNNCGDPAESPPDVQPGAEFAVTRSAHHGRTYLGMVVRENDTWEAVSQKLATPIKKGECYEMNVFLTQSDVYLSPLDEGGPVKSFTTPATFRVWGGKARCDRGQLLAVTPEIKHYDWKEYTIKLKPEDTYYYIILEAYYKTPVWFPYNGNILVDQLSPIRQVPCPEDLIAVVESKEFIEPSTPEKTPSPPKPKKEDKVVLKMEGEELELKKGETVRLNMIRFDPNDHKIKIESYPALHEIYNFLNRYSGVHIEISGHTNSNCSASFCDRLSLLRAREVAAWLVKKGVDPARLEVQGYGKRRPIASNDTPEGRKMNIRVEIKIIKVKED